MDISWNKWKSSKCREKQPLDSFPSLWPMIMRKLYPTACTLTKKAQVNGKKAHQILTFTQKPPGAVLQILRKFTNLHFFFHRWLSSVKSSHVHTASKWVLSWKERKLGRESMNSNTKTVSCYLQPCCCSLEEYCNVGKRREKKTWILPGWKLNKS